MDDRQTKLTGIIAETGADWALLTTPDAVAWASGHVVPIEAGPSPFAHGPTAVLAAQDGTVALVAANVEGAAPSRAAHTELYEGFSWEGMPDIAVNYRAAFECARAALGVGGTVAVQPGALPLALSHDLGPTVPIDAPLARARAVKTAEEITAMRRAAEVASIGQRAFRTAARPGRTELAAFGEIRTAMEEAAGERLPVTGDFLSGTARTAGFTGWPTGRVMQPGDPVMSDLAPRVDGYWGDSCASAMLGEPTPAYRALFATARDALDLAVELIRPGLRVCELDRRLRERVAQGGHAYPHHSGHSLGTSVHEWPRLIPAETAPLEAGMLLMVEPGAYDPDLGGVRTEWMLLVTETGCEVLTDFPLDPALPA